MKIFRSMDTIAPAEEIWSSLVDPDKIMEWCLPCKKLLHTGAQRSGLGTTFSFEEKAVGRLMKLNFVVTEWVANRSVAFTMTSGDVVRRYEQRYTIESMPRGSRFTCTEYITLPYGFLGRVAGLFVRFGSEARVKAMMTRLRSMAEGPLGVAGTP